MKMQTPQYVREQIDKTVNPNRKLGKIKQNNPITLSYRDKEDVGNENLTTVSWKKRYYTFDRGDFYPLDMEDFKNYYGERYRSVITGQYGNFTDYLTESYSNIQYSVEVYANEDKNISLTINMAGGSLSVYVNQIQSYQSSPTSPYIKNTMSLYLVQGWNRIDLFIYNKTQGQQISVENDLGKKIDSWRSIDDAPPAAPTWADTNPIVTEYVDALKSSQLQNVLRWKNVHYNDVTSNARGWGVYRKVYETVKDTNDANITVVSGWTGAFAVNLNRQWFFPSNVRVATGQQSYATVSGTNYKTDLDQTYVYTKSVIDYTVNAGNSITKEIYKHLFDVEDDPTLPYIVSGIDSGGIRHRAFYEYCLDAYDDSVNSNRSAKSSTQSVYAGDFAKPTNLIADNIVGGSLGGLKRISVMVWNPNYWAPPQNDVRGFRVWETANPHPPTDKPAENIPINVSGTCTTIKIDNTSSGATLLDKTAYTFYLSCYDWFGNEDLTDLPSITSTTKVQLKTDPGSSRVELDSDNNCIHIYCDLEAIET